MRSALQAGSPEELADRDGEVAGWLRAARLRVTPQRLAIARELAHDRTHPTAQELFERLRKRLPSMSFATVYNTLSALSERGFCVARTLRSASLGVGAMRFDPNVTPHDHAVCERCGAVADVPTESRPTPAVEGFSITRVETVFRGVCRACERRAP